MAFASNVTVAAGAAPEGSDGGSTIIALFLLVVIVAAWIGLRMFVRSLRARKTESAVGTRFNDFAREAHVNAAKIDGRVNDQERAAVSRAMCELAGAPADEAALVRAFAEARLTKNELVDYLAAKGRAFPRMQKMALLKALLAVFVADGTFDETEHAALVDYTAAIGFDRQSAPEMLRGIARDFARGNIT